MVETFGTRLFERIRALGPLCVGIDPGAALMAEWHRPDSIDGLEFCSLAVLEAVLGTAAAIKPQVAHFERFGAAGYRVLERVMADARDADVLIVADAKRGDIDVTNESYAEAWLADRSPLVADALTVHPYLGVRALAPLFARATQTGRGVFVVAATSNAEGRVLQTARTAHDEPVEELVLREVAEINARVDARGAVGIVLGATRDRPHFDLSMLGGPLLVPGVGAQGATPDNVARLFERCAPGSVLVNVGRAITSGGPERAALRDAARRWRDDLSAALA